MKKKVDYSKKDVIKFAKRQLQTRKLDLLFCVVTLLKIFCIEEQCSPFVINAYKVLTSATG